MIERISRGVPQEQTMCNYLLPFFEDRILTWNDFAIILTAIN